VNRLSSIGKTSGVILKAILKDKILFADYYPHLPLGDRPLDLFLSEFKYQEHIYDQKVFDLLLKDHTFQSLDFKTFLNHELWDGMKFPEALVVKYKLQGPDDQTFLPLLSKGVRVRLDLNGLFTREEYLSFLKKIPDAYLPLIEYVEDPLKTTGWENLPLPSARDFISGTPFQFSIYKPNCEFKPNTDLPIIYSSYLGGNLGRWHAYCELINNGDLSLTHGIYTQGFYEEEILFFDGSYRNGFKPNHFLVKSVYHQCAQAQWKILCSM